MEQRQMWKYWVFISNTPSHRRSHHLVKLSTGCINIARQFQLTSHYNAMKAFMGTNPFVASYKSTTPFLQTHHHVPSQCQKCFTQIVSSNLNWCPLLLTLVIHHNTCLAAVFLLSPNGCFPSQRKLRRLCIHMHLSNMREKVFISRRKKKINT